MKYESIKTSIFWRISTINLINQQLFPRKGAVKTDHLRSETFFILENYFQETKSVEGYFNPAKRNGSLMAN